MPPHTQTKYTTQKPKNPELCVVVSCAPLHNNTSTPKQKYTARCVLCCVVDLTTTTQHNTQFRVFGWAWSREIPASHGRAAQTTAACCSQSDVAAKRRRTIAAAATTCAVIADISDVLPAQQAAQHVVDLRRSFEPDNSCALSLEVRRVCGKFT